MQVGNAYRGWSLSTPPATISSTLMSLDIGSGLRTESARFQAFAFPST